MSGPIASANVEHVAGAVERPDRVPSPAGSSDGSTTVSATSSPGIDQQEEQEELHAMQMKMRMPEMAFKTVDEIYSHPTTTTTTTATTVAQVPVHFQQQNSTSSSSNGHEETSPRKKPRKQQM